MTPPYPERAGEAADAALRDRRGQMRAAVAAGRFAVDPPPVAASLGGVRALRFEPSGAARATVLHFHGGGLRLGCPEAIAPYAAALAARCAVEVVCPAYRLAPEHPFPAAINDAWAVCEALRPCGPLLIAGDSAGGGIAASLAALRVAADRAPAGLLLVSPWLDLTVSAASYAANAASDPAFSRAAARQGAAAYLRGLPADDPRASPRVAALAGFPPTFVAAATDEVLADDARGMARALAAAGTPAELFLRGGMEHAAMTRDLALPGATETFAAAAAFVDRLLA